MVTLFLLLQDSTETRSTNKCIFLSSDRHLAAVAKRLAGKQQPIVKYNREPDDVTLRAARSDGTATNRHGAERERIEYSEER